MTEQIHGTDGDYIVIRGTLQNLKTLKIIPFQIVVRDGFAVASFGDPSFARKMVKNENRHGNKNIKYSQQINSAIEKYEGMKKEKIAKIIGKKLSDGGAKIIK